MKLLHIDHFVLTVASIGQTVNFYRDVLGMEPVTFAEGRVALEFGAHKINLHEAGAEFQPHARQTVPGSADVCLIVENISDALAHLHKKGIDVFEGPVPRTGAKGTITSIYMRDPDGNLIELAEYDDA
ncbi:MAG: VOC family protein [Rhizobiales bacterium]|nr:VOC family protein [Hyphomicrobiales bacterium]